MIADESDSADRPRSGRREHEVNPHVLFEALAYFVGFQIYLRERRRAGDPIDAATRWSIVAAAIVGAAVGSRLLYWSVDPALTVAHWDDVRYLLGGKTVVGGMLGGVIAVEMTKRALGVTRRTGDLFAVPLAVGIAIGRVGCFLSGLPDRTYGIQSHLPWSVDFGDGIPRHPVQLYESLAMIALAFWLRRLARRPHREGDLFRLFLVAYLCWRLAIDFLKPDPSVVAGLSAIQIAALAGMLVYARDVHRWLNSGIAHG